MREVAIYRTMKIFCKRPKNQPVISRIIDHDLKESIYNKKPHPSISYLLKEQIVE
jgi:hypothetical protein